MLNQLLFTLCLFGLTFSATAQEITKLELVPNKTVAFAGTLENGVVMEDLS